MNDTLLWYTTRGAGAVSMLLLSGAVGVGILTTVRFEAAGWPRFLIAALHRNLSVIALIFLGLHIVTAVVDPFAHLGWLTAVLPFSTSYRAFWMALGAISSDLVVAIVATSLLRRLFGPGTWRAVHWLAYAAWPVALLHGIGAGTDAASDWMIVVDFVSGGIVLIAVAGRLLAPRPNRLAGERERFRTSVRREVTR